MGGKKENKKKEKDNNGVVSQLQSLTQTLKPTKRRKKQLLSKLKKKTFQTNHVQKSITNTQK